MRKTTTSYTICYLDDDNTYIRWFYDINLLLCEKWSIEFKNNTAWLVMHPPSMDELEMVLSLNQEIKLLLIC
jgi:hypothetical protein